jgi:hypothetical protein
MAYAEGTSVPIEKSKAEIERTLSNYGASQFLTGWDDKRGLAVIQFEMKNRRIRFTVGTMKLEDFRKTIRKDAWGTPRERERTDSQAKTQADKENRRRWRALLLTVKAKMEAVETGISSFEEEFMAHIVTASGQTIGEMIIPKLDKVASSGKLPPLLPGRAEEE